jgi:diacylglycerol kinase family enzyme
VLGIYIIAPLDPWIVAKLSWGAVRGQWKALPEVSDREAREVTIRFPRKKTGAMAVIDGELVKLAETVELKIHPHALQVVMPTAATDPADDPAEIVLTPA